MFVDFCSSLYFGCFFYLALLLVIALLLTPKTSPNSSAPWVGGYESRLSRSFVPWISCFYGQSYLEKSYHEFGKRDQVCIMPTLFGNHVMLPPSMIPWLLEQPEDTLSAKGAQVDAVEAPITMLKPEVALNPVHEEVVRRQFKVHLGALTEKILDEIQVCIHELCESDTQEDGWTEVNLDFVLRRTITRASNRAFIGLPICRDTQYIENAIRYVDAISTTGLILKLVSFFPKQLFTRMLTLKTRYHYGQCAKYLRPLFEKTIAAWQAEPHCLPNNYASWSVEQAMKRDDKLEQSSDMLARRAMALNFAAVHTTTMTAANLILDLASSTKEPNDLGRVRREADYVQERYDKRWSRAMLAEMSLLDSALRESMRVSGFGTKVFNRKVTASRGVMLPNGLHVSHGANVAVSGYSMHHDEAIYQEPQRFIASRFMGSSHASGSEKATPRKTAVTTEFSYGIWGHGRHACPGRFFAVDMIKMIVAYLVSNFDIKPLHKRPKNLWVADVVVPDRRVTIKLRRRK